MPFEFSDRSKRYMTGVDEDLVRVAFRAIEISPIDFGIPSTGGLRTAQIQNELFKDGKSKNNGFETPSDHQFGLALDVYAFVNGKASWEISHLVIIAGAMFEAARQLGVKIEWGGLWRHFQDLPHFKIIKK